jgi:multicomponent K+:H+ antiporter subunit A
VLTGVASWFFGAPFLTSTNAYVTVPPLAKVHLASAIPFDLGVFLTVVGSVMLALASLSRLGRRAGEGVNLTAMDVDPSQSTDERPATTTTSETAAQTPAQTSAPASATPAIRPQEVL